MRKETKIGIFAIITIALAIWGYNFIRGFNLLSQKTTIYAVYERVDGLKISTPVLINGLQVGLVADFQQLEGNLSRIEVVMNIDPDIKIPEDAVAEIVSSSLMGGSEIHITFEGTCSGDSCVQSGEYIEGKTRSLLSSFTSPDEISAYMDEVSEGLTSVLDTLNKRLSQSEEVQGSLKDARVILENLRSTTDRMDRLMSSSSGSIDQSLKNVEAITTNLKDNNEKISSILANAEKLSGDLSQVDMQELSGTVQQTMEQLKTTLSSSDEAIKKLASVLGQLDKGGEGAIAMLLHDEEFAGNLHLVVKDLDLLLQDIRLHPERYRRILSKKKDPYEFPEEDPADPARGKQ